MSTNLIAILASAGLLTAGVAATSETRSAVAIPVAKVSALPVAAHAPGVSTNRQGNRPDCSLPANVDLPACANPGSSGAALSGGTGSGTSAAVLGVLAAGAVGVGVAVAAKGSKTDSNG